MAPSSPGTRVLCTAVAAAAALLAPAVGAAADFSVIRVATGLERPLFLTAPPGDTTRVFIVEQRVGMTSTGRIRILDLGTGELLPTAFLEITMLATGFEQGLLGLAFHPDYASNGYLYVNYTNAADDTRIVRYEVSAGDPNVADPGSAAPVTTIVQPQTNHNGGWMAFGGDGYLYVSSGDGGGGNDNGTGHTAGTGNAQDVTANPFGKILRLDIDGDDFPGSASNNFAIPPSNPFPGEAIWVYGLRNPWRPSFDRLTGDLYIADVGQDAREELNVQPAASEGGENYGWRLREGTIPTPTPEEDPVGGPQPPDGVNPFYEYEHGAGATQGGSVTGGYVYRGAAASLQGRYFFADFVNQRIWSLSWDGSDPSGFDGTNFTGFVDWTDDPDFAPDQGSFGGISSFGEDAEGNLYLLSLGGDVFRITATAGLGALRPGALATLAGALLSLAALRLARR